MTDEQMAARLRRAGAAWRAANETAARVPVLAEDEPLTLGAPANPRRFRRTGLFASAALVAAALVAGGTVLIGSLIGHDKRPSVAASLEGTVWRLVGYDEHDGQGSLATLYVGRNGQLVADDECTVIGATVRLNGHRLGLLASDLRYRGCVDTTSPIFGTRGYEILTAVPSVRVSGTELTIRSGEQVMHLVAAPDLPAPTLDVPTVTSTQWRLTGIEDANGTATTTANGAGLSIGADELRASDGCSKLRAPIAPGASSAEIGTVTRTPSRGSCPTGPAPVIDAVLSGHVDYRVTGTELTVTKPGVGTLTYEWVPRDKAATDPSAVKGHDWHLVSVAGEPVPGAVNMYVSPTSQFSITFGCGAVGGRVHVGIGTLRSTDLRNGPAAGCSGALADVSSTVQSFFRSGALWRVRDRTLIVYGGGAQAFSLVFEDAAPPVPAPRPLVGTRWVLDRILDTDKNEVSIAGNAALLIDGSGHLTGSDGCNSISGDVTHDKTIISFGNGLATTERACADPQVTATAKRVDAVLSADVQWRITGDELALTKDGAGTLVYKAAAAITKSTDPSDLIRLAWNLTTIENGGVAHTVTGKPTLRVGAHTLHFTDGCNTNRGTATVGTGTLDITGVGGTYAYCRQSIEVTAVLRGHVTWIIEGDQLTITKDGAGALVYTRK